MKVFFSYKIPKSYCIILFFTFEIFYFKHKIYHIIYVWTITNSHTTTYIWILNVYTIPTFEKKNFKDKKISTFLQKSVLFSYYFYIYKYLFQLSEVALMCISHSESFIRIWIHMQIQFLNIPTFEKKISNIKKWVLFFKNQYFFSYYFYI